MRFRILKTGRTGAAACVSLLVVVLAVSCYDHDFGPQDFDVVAAVYDKQANFGTIRTFFLADSIYHNVGSGEDNITRAYDHLILSQLAAGLEGVGYQRITTGQPDVAVQVVASTTDYIAVGGGGCYPYYWGWYPCYPYYPPTATSYSTGTVTADMVDLRGQSFPIPEGAQPPLIWRGALNGILDIDTISGVERRITAGIQKMFAISPYLGVQ